MKQSHTNCYLVFVETNHRCLVYIKQFYVVFQLYFYSNSGGAFQFALCCSAHLVHASRLQSTLCQGRNEGYEGRRLTGLPSLVPAQPAFSYNSGPPATTHVSTPSYFKQHSVQFPKIMTACQSDPDDPLIVTPSDNSRLKLTKRKTLKMFIFLYLVENQS